MFGASVLRTLAVALSAAQVAWSARAVMAAEEAPSAFTSYLYL